MLRFPKKVTFDKKSDMKKHGSQFIFPYFMTALMLLTSCNIYLNFDSSESDLKKRKHQKNLTSSKDQTKFERYDSAYIREMLDFNRNVNPASH